MLAERLVQPCRNVSLLVVSCKLPSINLWKLEMKIRSKLQFSFWNSPWGDLHKDRHLSHT